MRQWNPTYQVPLSFQASAWHLELDEYSEYFAAAHLSPRITVEPDVRYLGVNWGPDEWENYL